MELDIKQQVLIAFYLEYQKDIPDMKQVTTSALGIGKDELNMAIVKLANEGLITGEDVIWGGNNNTPQAVLRQDILLTPKGLEYVENKIGLKNVLTGKEKVDYIIKNIPRNIYTCLESFGAKVLVEIMKNPN